MTAPSVPSKPARALNSSRIPALLLIDLQQAIDDPAWAQAGPRNNPQAERNVATLLSAWRLRGWPVIHIRHASREPQSTFRPGGPGARFKPEAEPFGNEPVLDKHTANAFLSTDLDARLRRDGIHRLAVVGVITNNSVESTVRMGAEIGYDVTVVEDATFTFARVDRRGRTWPAEDVHQLSMANLEQGEYARVVSTEELLQQS